jgi:hypothetical protein
MARLGWKESERALHKSRERDYGILSRPGEGTCKNIVWPQVRHPNHPGEYEAQNCILRCLGSHTGECTLSRKKSQGERCSVRVS